MSESILILGNQLFPIQYYQKLNIKNVFMLEEMSLCTHFKYHKHKIVLFLSAMRSYRDQLRKSGFNVYYKEITESQGLSYEKHLLKYCADQNINKIHIYEVEDKFFEKRLNDLKIKINILESPLFLVSRSKFEDYLKTTKKPFMKSFYESNRQSFNILMNGDRPIGGKYSFDSENRKKMPKSIKIPYVKPRDNTKNTAGVIKDVNNLFSDHPGETNNFLWATTRDEALRELHDFIEFKIDRFGAYQDSITNRDPFLFHSLISPYLNMGLILPGEVIRSVEDAFHQKDLPLNSVEGFIRQVIGWREFVRGVYQNYSSKQDTSNFFNHKRKIPKLWKNAKTGFPFLDDVIKKSYKYSYAHHIERLMILGNMMVLLEIEPFECYKWFMEMYIDSSDWVMGPNVYGMALFSDGGIFATKPYICGSNYYKKMSDYPKGDWCAEVDALYWGFISKHIDFFKSQYRMRMMVSMWNKKTPEQKKNNSRKS